MNHARSICVYTLISRAWGHYFVQGPSHLRDQLAFKTHSLLFNNIQFSEEVTGKLGKTALKKPTMLIKPHFLTPATKQQYSGASYTQKYLKSPPKLHHFSTTTYICNPKYSTTTPYWNGSNNMPTQLIPH